MCGHGTLLHATFYAHPCRVGTHTGESRTSLEERCEEMERSNIDLQRHGSERKGNKAATVVETKAKGISGSNQGSENQETARKNRKK